VSLTQDAGHSDTYKYPRTVPVRGEINRAIAPVHVTLLSPLFTPVGPLAAESKFQQLSISGTRILFLKPDCALLIFREVWTSVLCHQIFDFLNFNITNLTFSYFLLQGRFHFYSNSLCMSNYSQVEPFKVICQLIR
jgi:hypothetical protein